MMVAFWGCLSKIELLSSSAVSNAAVGMVLSRRHRSAAFSLVVKKAGMAVMDCPPMIINLKPSSTNAAELADAAAETFYCCHIAAGFPPDIAITSSLAKT